MAATKKTTIKKTTKTKTDVSGPVASLFNLQGEKIGEVNLPESVFAVKVNKDLIIQAVRVARSNVRAGSAHTKTRGEIRGGGRKPWMQKGTGRARQGSIRSPLWVGGGITFGPIDRNFKLSMPKKMRRGALLSALTVRQGEKVVVAVEGLLDVLPKTRNVAKFFSVIAPKGGILLILPERSVNAEKSCRNIHGVTITYTDQLSVYDVLSHRALVFAKEGIERISKWTTQS